MKIYAIIATILSTLFSLLPIYIAKTTDHGDELCDPELFYSGERVCALLWDRTLLFFALYFAVATIFFIALFLYWKLIMWALKTVATMKGYAIIATILSVLFGILPLYMAKISEMDNEICHREIWLETGKCAITLGRGLFTFSLYFAIAATFFIALALFWKLIMQMLGKQ